MNYELDDEELMACQAVFNKLDPEERLFMTHYTLAKETEITDSQAWKRFLMDTRVANWIDQEVTVIKNITLRKMIKDADSNVRSYGAAQMMNALNKSFESDAVKEGPIFVYTYVPLNAREQGAPNTMQADRDLFERS
jgi:hypothetical protein